MTDWPGLIGMNRADLVQRTGSAGRDRKMGDELWVMLDLSGHGLRVRFRLGADGDFRVASWTASLHVPTQLLSEATGRLDLWPAAAPEADASSEPTPLVRRPIIGPDDRKHSLTATIRGGMFRAVTVFDEAPEWL